MGMSIGMMWGKGRGVVKMSVPLGPVLVNWAVDG